MSELRMIGCDGCGRDLTSTGNSEDWRLALINERIPPWYIARGLHGGAVTDVAIAPVLNQDAHFCSVRCLSGWLETR